MSGQLERREPVLAAFLVSLGIGAWLHWSITYPSFDQTEAQSEWGHVLAFSALVLALAAGSAALGHALSRARSVRCLTVTLIAAAALAAVTNIVEDGLGVGRRLSPPHPANPRSARPAGGHRRVETARPSHAKLAAGPP